MQTLISSKAISGPIYQYMFLFDSIVYHHEYMNIDVIEVLGYLGGMHEVLSILCSALVAPYASFIFNLSISRRYYGVQTMSTSKDASAKSKVEWTCS